MANESLRIEWELRFEEFSRSEMSVVDWCSSNLVPLHQFYYWRRKFADNEKSEAPSWLAVDVVEPIAPLSAASGVSVRLGQAVIDVQAGFDSAVLRAVVAALEPARC
jgi:hypothetical protein